MDVSHAVAVEPLEGSTGYVLEVPDRPNGPVVTRLLRRAALAGGALAGAALLGLARARTPRGKATALGALAPGAGYAYTRNPIRAAGTVGAFAAALFAWFGTGNIVAPPAVWAAAALDARRRADRGDNAEQATVLVPAALAAAVAAGVVARRRAFRAAQERGRRRAEYLRVAPRLDPKPVAPGPMEHDEEDLATLRAFLDRGLQPVDGLAGFDVIEQFQTAAVRYQIFMSQWALALSQLHRTPAFRGYLSAAQRNLIDKLTGPRLWGYWRWEQLWGNLSADFDPMKRDNVMLSGYLGVCLGAYESNTGDTRYRRAGSLPFRLGRRVWPYDHDRLAAAVHDNMARSGLTLYPCEPNWVYSMCNAAGISALLLSDRLHDTRYVADVGDAFRRRLREEFVTPDGRITAIRSARLGLTIPMLTSMIADCSAAAMLHAFDPDLARRSWTIVRHEFIDTSGDEPALSLRGWDAIDTGNYQPGKAGARAMAMWAAAEMGDRDLYARLREANDRHARPRVLDGARWYEAASTQVNAVMAIARFDEPGGYARLVNEGPGDSVLSGPYLEGASYPEVLVASAGTDGRDLRLVVRPGDEGGRRVLGVEGLVPGGAYDVRGALESEVVADGAGRARVTVDLDGRTEVAVVPAG